MRVRERLADLLEFLEVEDFVAVDGSDRAAGVVVRVAAGVGHLVREVSDAPSASQAPPPRDLLPQYQGMVPRKRPWWKTPLWFMAGLVIGTVAVAATLVLVPEESSTEWLDQAREFVWQESSPGTVRTQANTPTVPNMTSTENQSQAVSTPTRVRPVIITDPYKNLYWPTVGNETQTAVVTPINTSQRPTPTQPGMRLTAELPRDVFEEFEDDFYEGCLEPSFESLRIENAWTGRRDENVRISAPDGTYFLVLVATPTDPDWYFRSVLDSSSGSIHRSLTASSDVPDELTDAQQWCQTSGGFGATVPDYLRADAHNVEWTVYLVTERGSAELPREVETALSGYYGLCPPRPPLESLEAVILGSGRAADILEYTALPPFYFLGVEFEPNADSWEFSSVEGSGNWLSAGPSVSSVSGERIDFTAICPQEPSSHHLDIQSEGDTWTVYLITVREQ